MIARLILLLGLFASTALAAMTPAEAERLLAADQNLIIQGRAPLTGKAQQIVDDTLVFRSTRGGGSLEYRFPLETVERLQFPGGELVSVIANQFEAGQNKEALVLMKMLFDQRAPFLPLLTPNEIAYFLYYAEMQYRYGNPYTAVGAGRSILPYAEDETLRRKVNDLVLLGHYQLPLKEDTLLLAQEWIAENEPYGPSALGYYILGRMAFDEERFDDALWRSLEPVTFSSQFPMDYLDYCYALAIAACIELEQKSEETALRQEMAERGIAWPEDLPKLAPYRNFNNDPPASPE